MLVLFDIDGTLLLTDGFSRSQSARRGLIPLHHKETTDEDKKKRRLLRRHTTHFMKLVIPRQAIPDVFKLRKG